MIAGLAQCVYICYHSSMSNHRSTQNECYFAHHVTDYNTRREASALQALESAGFTVVNPNTPAHNEAYRRMGMEHFLGVVATCGALAFQRFTGGEIGAGVGKEIATAARLHLPIYEVYGTGGVPEIQTVAAEAIPALLDTVLSVEYTRALLTRIRAGKY